MSKASENINEEVEKTLRAIDNVKRASPDPFFFTRLQGKLEAPLSSEGTRLVLSSVIYRIAIGFVVILAVINIFSGIQFLRIGDDASMTSVDQDSWVGEYYPQSSSFITVEDE